MMHALVGEGEGEADAEGARTVDARVAGAGVGGAVVRHQELGFLQGKKVAAL